MQSSIGNFLRRVADECDRGCGVSSEEFEKVAKLQLKDHDDIQTLMTSVLILKRKVDDLSQESQAHEPDGKCVIVEMKKKEQSE